MAPIATPNRKNRDRENNFFDVGVQGRKTGITLRDTGIRDEHGMMPIDDIFSSPDKSPRKQSPQKADATLTTSEDMDVEHSSMPDPVETLSTRRLLRNSKTIIPPPLGRSPMKTFLGSSPRRQSSMGPPSQRRSNATPSRHSPLPIVSRRLDFTKDDPQPSIEVSPTRTSAVLQATNGASRESPRELETPSSVLRKRSRDEPVHDDDISTGAHPHVNRTRSESTPPLIYDHDLPIMEDPVGDGEENSVAAVEYVPEEVADPPAKRRRGRPRKSDEENVVPDNQGKATAQVTGRAKRREPRQSASHRSPAVGIPSDMIDPALLDEESPATTAKRSRDRIGKRPPLASTAGPVSSKTVRESTTNGSPSNESDVEDDSVHELEPEAPPARRNKATASTKSSKVTVHRDQARVSNKPSSKKGSRKGRSNQSTAAASGQPIGFSGRFPVERDVNARHGSATATEEGHSGGEGPSKQGDRNRRSRSLQILRQGTPLDEPGARTTRYGRTSVKPVDWWRGERVDRQWDGTIQGVVRAEDVDVPKRKAQRKRAAAKRGMSAIAEEQEEEKEEWEVDPGILTGFVASWDEERCVGVEGEEREEQLAWASSVLETRDVVGSNFRYTKCLSLPFFGSGLVDLPPGGFKRLKNSRRMQMIFFVHYGTVNVNVADSQFRITTGGTWQVPRGNSYSIENHADKPARIFFAQGCLEILEVEE